MAEVYALTKCEYLVGYLQEDTRQLAEMILRNYHQGRFMSKDLASIRAEDVRINFTPQVQNIARTLCREWHTAFGREIELCWQNQPGQDPNTAFWAVIHNKNESTNLHTHESSDNYEGGAQVSAAYYVQVPENSGDIVFQYNENPYIIKQRLIPAEANKFIMFDSTVPHFVTKNLSDEHRIVISMNFKYKDS